MNKNCLSISFAKLTENHVFYEKMSRTTKEPNLSCGQDFHIFQSKQVNTKLSGHDRGNSLCG